MATKVLLAMRNMNVFILGGQSGQESRRPTYIFERGKVLVAGNEKRRIETSAVDAPVDGAAEVKVGQRALLPEGTQGLRSDGIVLVKLKAGSRGEADDAITRDLEPLQRHHSTAFLGGRANDGVAPVGTAGI